MYPNKFQLICYSKWIYFLFFSIVFLAIFNIFFISNGNFIVIKKWTSSSKNNGNNNLEEDGRQNLKEKYFEENDAKNFVPKLMTIDQIIDLKKCPTPFRIGLAQNGTNKFWAKSNFLYKWILESNYFTLKREEVCIEIHLVENEENNFDKMNQNGQNQIVIFMRGIIPPKRNKQNEMAIFVANQFAEGDFHPAIDFHLETDILDFDENFSEKLPMIDSNQQNGREELFSCQFLFDENFGQIEEEILKICRNQMEKIIPISDAFGTFIIGNMPKLPTIILQILGNGSVPILFGPNPIGPIGISEGLLPFNHLIHWENAIIWVSKFIQTEIDEILKQISPKKWSELRRNGRFIFEHYLGNARVLIRSIFSDIRQRIGLPAPIELATNLPQLLAIPAKNATKNNTKFDNFDNSNIFYSPTIFEDLHYLWNKNPTYLDAINPILAKNVHSDLFNNNGDTWVDLTERFTVIICTFRRDVKLAFSLRRLEGIPNLDRILIIWNDIQRTLPPEIFPQIDVPIFVLNGTRNSMLNRFLPLAQIRTEAIFILDDDIDIGPNFGQKIHFGFRVWQQNRHRLVGPIFRLGHSGHYEGSPQCHLNMVLTDISFISLAYFRAFNREMSPKIRSIIKKETNCDDIAINFLVAHFTGQSPLKILDIKNVVDLKIPTTENEDANGHKGLANRRNHYQIRSECVKMFTRIFGYNPNIQTNYRIDPLWDGEMAEKCQRKEEEEMENYNSLKF